jgi:hypothetical protein
MLLPSDVGPEQGPMRYKLGTHQKPSPRVDHFFYQYFRKGIDFCYVSLGVVQKAPGEEKLVLGRAGDCIFFDTTGPHAGSRCEAGERVALVFGVTEIPSLRNRVISALSGGMWM